MDTCNFELDILLCISFEYRLYSKALVSTVAYTLTCFKTGIALYKHNQ